MNCGKIKAKRTSRDIIQGLFDKGKKGAAFRHRLTQCLHASDCGRICRRLVKAYGIRIVACVDAHTGEETPLYESLEDPEFECPEGLF